MAINAAVSRPSVRRQRAFNLLMNARETGWLMRLSPQTPLSPPTENRYNLAYGSDLTPNSFGEGGSMYEASAFVFLAIMLSVVVLMSIDTLKKSLERESSKLQALLGEIRDKLGK